MNEGLVAWIALALVTLAVGVASVKWLRVAQREHYLGGSIIAMRPVWLSSRIWNWGEIVLLVAALAGWVIRPDPVWLLLGSSAVVAFPIGLDVAGRTSPLVWTARLKRVAVLTAVVLIGSAGFLAWIVALTTGRKMIGTAAMAGVVLFPIMVDIALWLAAPIERRLSQQFVDRATLVLSQVRPVVVGITGSYGKTSTKWYVAHLARETRRVVASPASFNNRLGLARAVNEHLTADAEVFVAEMGTYARGEIADLCSWLPPSIAVITAIGPVHLQRFKSEERIVEAKSEIVEGADAVVLNVDHPLLAALADRLVDEPARRVWRCGTSEMAADVRVSEVGEELTMTVRGEEIGRIPSAGIFPHNLACALAVAIELGVDIGDLPERAVGITPAEHRQSISKSSRGFTIIDDTFNSNPAGAARALEVLAGVGGPDATRVVVTPGMVELGTRQRRENARFGAAAAAVGDVIVVVGRTNRKALVSGAGEGEASVVLMDNREKAVAWVRSHLGSGDAVLYENDLPDHYP